VAHWVSVATYDESDDFAALLIRGHNVIYLGAIQVNAGVEEVIPAKAWIVSIK
jgi:hypothetical protein